MSEPFDSLTVRVWQIDCALCIGLTEFKSRELFKTEQINRVTGLTVFDSLTVWQSDSPWLLRFDSLNVFHCDSLIVCQSTLVGVKHSDSIAVSRSL